MNILFLCDEYPPGPHGGIGTAVQTLARALVHAGHSVVVAGFYDWGYGGLDEEWDQGVHVHRYRRGLDGAWARSRDALPVRIAYRLMKQAGVFQWDIERSLPRYARFLQKLLAEHAIDIVEASDFQDYVQRLNHYTPLPPLPVPVVVKLHGSITYFNEEAGTPTSPAIRDTEQHLLQSARLLLGVSKYTAARTADIFDLQVPCRVIYNGLDLRTIPLPPAKRTPLQVIFSGTLVAKKGIYQLLKAWNGVVAMVPEAELLVYGKGPLHKLLPILSAAAARQVRFMGHVSRAELLIALSNAPAAVFPSYAETFGLGALEAMACGAAVIYSTRTAGPEVVRDGVDGMLVDPDNVPDLTAALVSLLQSPHLCHRLGRAARLRATEQFNIEELASDHVRLYESVVRNAAL